jgi:hypothetical protein
MIQTCANIDCNIGIEALWFLLGQTCSYFYVLRANKRVKNSSEQWIGLIWLGKSPLVLSCEKVMKLLASHKSVISWQLAWLLPIQETSIFTFFSSFTSSTDSLYVQRVIIVRDHTHTHTHTHTHNFLSSLLRVVTYTKPGLETEFWPMCGGSDTNVVEPLQ